MWFTNLKSIPSCEIHSIPKIYVVNILKIPTRFSHIEGHKHNYVGNQKSLLIFSTSHERGAGKLSCGFDKFRRLFFWVLVAPIIITLRCIITLPRLDNMHAAPFNQAAIKRIFSSFCRPCNEPVNIQGTPAHIALWNRTLCGAVLKRSQIAGFKGCSNCIL